jgi:magnesium-transporting ATPase (P-type)
MNSGRLQAPLQPYSLAFGSSAAETVFQEEYAKNNLQAANSSAVLVILFLLVLVCLTGCWFWLRFLATNLGGRYHAHDGSGSVVDDDGDDEREMQLAWLIVVGNTLVAVIMVVQLHCSARAHNMQRRLGIFSVVGILVIFAMNVSADLIGYSQLLETPYILSGLIYVFFLSKLLVVRAATICWTWLLLHTVYRYSATGLHSLFYAQFGSPLFLCAMTMMLHVLASDNERKVRQGHWLRNMANEQRCACNCRNSLCPLMLSSLNVHARPCAPQSSLA